MFEDTQEQAAKIHEVISLMASRSPVRVGINRPRLGEAVDKLRRGFFKKPFFASSKEWVRTIVINDHEAFKFLAGHIELEMAYKGRLYRWTGYGTKIYPNDDVLPQLQSLIL